MEHTNILAAEVQTELEACGDDYPLTIVNSNLVIIEIPETENTFHARLVMQGFNTEKFRAQRVDRSLRRVEVKYRKGN